MSIRGIRNCNPGNIDRNSTKWQGMADVQDDPRFVVFFEMKWGCRALLKLLQTYRHKYNLNSIDEIIGRWAPSNENNTDGYRARVGRLMGYRTDKDLPDTREAYVMLGKAIASVECTPAGAEQISDETWEEAADLAGL